VSGSGERTSWVPSGKRRGSGPEPRNRRVEAGAATATLCRRSGQGAVTFGHTSSHTEVPPAHQQTLPIAGIDLDPALWKNLSRANYGDPRSNSSSPSNGPGNGGGMGTENGSGIGEGLGRALDQDRTATSRRPKGNWRTKKAEVMETIPKIRIGSISTQVRSVLECWRSQNSVHRRGPAKLVMALSFCACVFA